MMAPIISVFAVELMKPVAIKAVQPRSPATAPRWLICALVRATKHRP
jgi:hypothetical protein